MPPPSDADPPEVSEPPEPLADERTGPGKVFRRALIKGTAVLLPLVVTLFVVSFVLGFISQQLEPLVVAVVETGVIESETLVTVATVAVFLLLVLAIGLVAEFGPGEHRLNDQFDEFMASLPGIGSVYTSFNEMTELLLDSDTDSFQDVKLVEYPGEDSYTVAFKTAETPDVIADATDNEDMVTLFMPMAPNPVMGGFVIHVSRERVVDVDLTVEEGIRSIVTSGVAIGHDEETMTEFSERHLRNVGDLEGGESVVAVDGPPGGDDEAQPPSDRDPEE